MSKRKPKRIIYRVTWDRSERVWLVNRENAVGVIEWECATKKEAITSAKREARGSWQDGNPAQVMVHKKDGKFQIEYSYGCESKAKG